MVARVDVVARRSTRSTVARPTHRVVAMTPAGRPDAGGRRRARDRGAASHDPLGALRGLRRARRANLATDAISIGPYVLSNGDLPAMVLIDAIARLLPGALGSEHSSVHESFSAELERGIEYPHYTRPAEFRGWRVPDVLLSGDPSASRSGVASRAVCGACAGEEPDRAPRAAARGRWLWTGWSRSSARSRSCSRSRRGSSTRTGSTPSMEPRLHCAQDGPGCLARFSDQVLANRFIYHFRDPERGDIVVFNTPPRAARAVPAGRDVRQADHRFAGRALGATRRRGLHQREEADRAVHPAGSPRLQHLRPAADPKGHYFVMGDNRTQVLRLAGVGNGAPRRTSSARSSTYWPPNRISFR